MTEPEEIFARCCVLLGRRGHSPGKRVLVSAGGTREPLDAVRYLGNRSSGRMGVALAEEARRRGADVTLLAANLAVPAPAGVAVVETPTAAELADGGISRARMRTSSSWPPPWPTTGPRSHERTSARRTATRWTVELEPTQDVLAELGRQRANGQLLVGFAADHGDARVRASAREARARRLSTSSSSTTSREADIGFDAAENEVVMILADGGERVGRQGAEVRASPPRYSTRSKRLLA